MKKLTPEEALSMVVSDGFDSLLTERNRWRRRAKRAMFYTVVLLVCNVITVAVMYLQ